MIGGTKPIDSNHREKGIQQTHTWDSKIKTCTPIIYSHPATESDDVEEIEDGPEMRKKSELQMMNPKMEL